MKAMIKPAVILLLITSIAAALLGVVQSITAAPIQAAEDKAQQEAMQASLPIAESFNPVEGEFEGTITAVNEGLNSSGNVIGYVISTNPSGFGGGVPTTVGIGLDGVITGVSVNTPSETPGLGALASQSFFTDRFIGKSGQLAVTKDGGEIEAITSSTITSRAVTGGVNEATAWFAENGGAN